MLTADRSPIVAATSLWETDDQVAAAARVIIPVPLTLDRIVTVLPVARDVNARMVRRVETAKVTQRIIEATR